MTSHYPGSVLDYIAHKHSFVLNLTTFSSCGYRGRVEDFCINYCSTDIVWLELRLGGGSAEFPARARVVAVPFGIAVRSGFRGRFRHHRAENAVQRNLPAAHLPHHLQSLGRGGGRVLFGASHPGGLATSPSARPLGTLRTQRAGKRIVTPHFILQFADVST